MEHHSSRDRIVIQPRIAESQTAKPLLGLQHSVFNSVTDYTRSATQIQATVKPDVQIPRVPLPSRTEDAAKAIHKKAKKILDGGIKKSAKKSCTTDSSSVVSRPPRDTQSQMLDDPLETRPRDMKNLECIGASGAAASSPSPPANTHMHKRRSSLPTRPSPLSRTISFAFRQSSPSTSSDESESSRGTTPPRTPSPPTLEQRFDTSVGPNPKSESLRYYEECAKCRCSKNSAPRCTRCELLLLSDR